MENISHPAAKEGRMTDQIGTTSKVDWGNGGCQQMCGGRRCRDREDVTRDGEGFRGVVDTEVGGEYEIICLYVQIR